MEFINKIFRGDRVIWMIFLFLCLISIVEVYSASSTLTFRTNYWTPIIRHTMFLLIGTALVLLIHSFKPKYLSVIGIALPLVWLLLAATRVMGQSVNDSYRWLTIGGQTIQPSEFAKLCLMVLTAFLLSKRKDTQEDKTFFWILFFASVTCLIILLDNFSTAIMLFLIIFALMFIGQIPFKKLFRLALILLCVGTLFLGFIRFAPDSAVNMIPRGMTWKERLIDFGSNSAVKDDTYKITDDNYQVDHASIAIANGRILGKLPGNSQERDFLPQAYSDFIYAIIIEEMGLIGGLFVIFLYITLFIRCGIIARRCDKLFPKFMVMGAALILVTQALVNMSVAVGLIPVTGQPLPLISRGGTSTLINCIYIGIILGVSRFENPKGVQREEEISEELLEEQEVKEAQVETIEA